MGISNSTSAAKLELNNITVKKRPNLTGEFGYWISYHGNAPAGCTLRLRVLEAGAFIDVTKRPSNNLIGAEQLPAFLGAIAKVGFWERKGLCRLEVLNSSFDIAHVSEPKYFPTPVEPMRPPRWPGMAGSQRSKLVYNPKVNGLHDGRYLLPYEIGGLLYFFHGGKLVVDKTQRGFDCVTYCGSVLGADGGTGCMGGTGETLATALGLYECGLENLSGPEMRAKLTALFEKKTSGTYLVWRADHCVICNGGTIHEFSESRGGYVETDVTLWHFHGGGWTARMSLKSFQAKSRASLERPVLRKDNVEIV